MTRKDSESLQSIKLLEDLGENELRDLKKHCVFRHHAAHEQIIDRDSDSHDVYFVTKGRVRVVNYSVSGREVSFDEVDEGGFFGELSAIDGLPRSATVVALTDTTVAAVAPKVFGKLMEKHQDVALLIIRRLAVIVRQSTDRIMDLSTLGAHNRVHAELLRLSRQVDEDANEAVIKPAPIHADIASRVSTTRETVARVLGDLSRSGLVTREKNSLVIHDVARLQALVEDFKDG